MKLSQVKSAIKETIRTQFKESVLEGKGIPKFFLKMGAVKKEIDKLTAERKSKYGGEYARKLNAETDPKKREQLKQPILAISQKITKLQANLADMYEKEEEYIQNLDKDTELDLAESVNESLKHLIHVGTPKEIVSKSVASQILALAKKGVRSNEIGLNMHFVGNEKSAVDTFQKVKNQIYFSLDKRNESVNESTFVKGKTYGGTKCEGGCFMGKTGLMKIIKISKESPNNVFMFRDDNYSGLQPHFIKDGVIAKANTIGNPSYDLEKHKVNNLKIGNDVILAFRLFV